MISIEMKLELGRDFGYAAQCRRRLPLEQEQRLDDPNTAALVR